MCIQCHGNPSNICQDISLISLLAKNVNLLVALKDKSGNTKVGPHFMAIYLIVFERFQSGPKHWRDQPTD